MGKNTLKRTDLWIMFIVSAAKVSPGLCNYVVFLNDKQHFFLQLDSKMTI